ncbi:zona pellucida sperm-binding protein 4-like [Heptranchias perlo]|uniref:zona pellucida sperm-binding protein 4-like n=1 Tax=Heptranchias perlo TaxID=212740 RepID=UPI00355A32C1
MVVSHNTLDGILSAKTGLRLHEDCAVVSWNRCICDRENGEDEVNRPLFFSPPINVGCLLKTAKTADFRELKLVSVCGEAAASMRGIWMRRRVSIHWTICQESDLQVKPRVYTLSPPLPATEAGILLLELRIARDGGYRSWYVASDYPILSVLREPVFVEVRVLNRNDPSLVLLLNDCWATPTAELYSGLRWDLLVDRCPFAGDNYKTRLLPVTAASHLLFPTHHNRFVVSTFAFWDRVLGRALTGEVYFHCSAEVCYPSTRENCTAPCSSKRRRSADNRSGALVTADGPILFLEGEERLAARIRQDEKDTAVDSPSRVPGLAVGAALLSVALLVGTVALWKMEQGRRVGSECSSMEL